MQKPDVLYALIKTHAGLHKQALSAFNRFLRILGLTVETNANGKKQLLVVETESARDEEESDEKEGGGQGSDDDGIVPDSESTEDEEEEEGNGTDGGRMAL